MLVIVAGVGFFTIRGVIGANDTSPTASTDSALGAITTPSRLVIALTSWRLPSPVSRAVVLAYGRRIVVLGGLASGDVSTDAIWRVDPTSGSATRLGQLTTAVHDAAGAAFGNRIDVFGGGSFSTVATVQSLVGHSTSSGAALPTPRSDLAAATIGSRTYVLGGFDGTSLQRPILETTDGSHFRVAGELTESVRYPAVASLGADVYVVGGQLGTHESTATGGQTSDIQRFDPATAHTAVIGHLPISLGHASAVVLGGELFVLGGRTGTTLSDAIWRVDPKTGHVTRIGTFSYPRSDAGTVTIGDKAYLVGGETTGPTAPLDTVVELRLTQTSSNPTPSASNGSVLNSSARRSTNIYAAAGANMFSPVVRHMPYRIYVPESGGHSVDVINPYTYKVISRYRTALDPQHVVPAWNLKTLYATNDLGNSLTPISPYTGRPEGPNIPVADPYNMYFTPDGHYAIVVEEARQILAFRNPRTFKLDKALHVNCAGVDHADFSTDGTYAIFSCEFSSQLVKIDLATQSVVGYLTLPGSSPQDVKLDPAGRIFYVADHNRGGVWEVSAHTFTSVGFIVTGQDAHGLYPSRNAKDLYVTNRGAGSIAVIDFETRKIVTTWTIPGGGSPDMGNVSPDGKVLWVSGRYDDCVYAISTTDGHLIATIPVPNMPHGLAVWPEPGRYSLGHTGIMR